MEISFFNTNNNTQPQSIIGEIRIRVYSMKAEMELIEISKQDALDVLYAIVDQDEK